MSIYGICTVIAELINKIFDMHRYRIKTKRFKYLDQEVTHLNTQTKALAVCRGANRANAVGEVAESVVPKPEHRYGVAASIKKV